MINLILATDRNFLIGNSENDNGMPWDIKEEIQYFKKMTMGHDILAGMPTFNKMGILKNRQNYTLTQDSNFKNEKITPFYDLKDVLAKYHQKNNTLFICGGKKIYQSFLPYCDYIYLTIIDQEFSGDVQFLELKSALSNFNLVSQKKGSDSRLLFCIYERKK